METCTFYDYSTPAAREETAAVLFRRAKSARSGVEREWERYNDYYNGRHAIAAQTADWARQEDLPQLPAGLPDPWILVESQVDPNVPEPEFRGRDSDLDSLRARQREYAVRYILENNRLADMNTRNERRLLKYGDAFWKAYWDPEARCGAYPGDVRIRDVPPEALYPDPAVREGTLQDGQFVDYVYRLHKVRFAQLFAAELRALGLTVEELAGDTPDTAGRLFAGEDTLPNQDDTLPVLEHWFRQPAALEVEGRVVPAGAVACSIQAGGRELRYIPDYWQRTHNQCRLFPFVHYWRIQDETRFYNKSELFPVLGLVDAADRALTVATLNDELMANDVLLVEEGALCDGEELTNEPGAVVQLKPGRLDRIRRLGGTQSVADSAAALEWYTRQVERASRSYETSRGREAQRTTTASGLAMIRQDADTQSGIKKADRNAGFERLFELLDWLALEFFDDGRLLFLGADEARGRAPAVFRFRADALAEPGGGEELVWPRVDVTVSAGDGLLRNRQAMLETLQTLAQSSITAENWRLYAAQLELLNLPGRQEIIGDWESRFAPPPPEERMENELADYAEPVYPGL